MAAHMVKKSEAVETSYDTFYKLFDWACTIPNSFRYTGGAPYYLEDGEGRIGWPLDETKALDEGAAIARSFGFFVEEFENGWSALLPCHESWIEHPSYACPGSVGDPIVGQCFVVTVIKDVPDDCIGLTTDTIEYSTDMKRLNRHGWRMSQSGSAQDAIISYIFDKALADAYCLEMAK